MLFFPNQDPVGKHFGLDSPRYAGSFEIVGVFADFKMNNPYRPVRPVFLRPLTQQFSGYKEPPAISFETQSMFIGSMILHFNAPQQNADALIRRTLAGIDPNLTVIDIRTYDAQVARNFNGERIVAQLTSLFGILALVLASVGLYGVMSYFVARRTSEIGIRMALGARRTQVVAMVFLQNARVALVGTGLGLIAALLASRALASFLYGTSVRDPWVFAGSILALAIIASAASLLPALRSARINPMVAIRCE